MSAIEELGRYYGAEGGADSLVTDRRALAASERDATSPSTGQASTSALDGKRMGSLDAGEDDAYIKHSVQRSDTLAKLAVQYNVAVSDIKRANGLMSEGMMFCRSKLLIPRQPLPLSDEQQRQVAQLVSGVDPIESTRSRKQRQWREGDEDKRAATAALDQLNSYYELGDAGSEPAHWGASPSYRRNGMEGGEVEMGTLPAGDDYDAYGDDRVRLRGRREQGESDWSAAGPSISASTGTSVNPFSACLPQQPLLSATGGRGPGLIQKYFGDLMEKPSVASRSAGPEAPRAIGSNASSGPSSGSGAPQQRSGVGMSSFMSRLSSAASKPAFASGGPSLSAIGDSMMARSGSAQQGPTAAKMRRHGSAVSMSAAAKGGKGE